MSEINNLFDFNNLIFNNKHVTVIIDQENNPWFKGKDVAEILEYSNIKKALQNHISYKYKLNYGKLRGTQFGSHENLNNIEKEIYISEAGLYELIFSSKLTIAVTFRQWVFEIVLPSIRKHGEYKLSKQISELREENNLLKINNKTLKNFVDNVKTKNKNSYIYIATSRQYANQNAFKIGKSDNLKNRLSSYNTNRTLNDKFYYCFYEKVFNVNKVESIINDLLEDFKDKKEKEMFILHYKYLLNLVELVIKNINEPYDYLNKLIKTELLTMYDLKPFIPKELNIDNLIVDELKKQILILLDECIETNNLTLSRKELITKLNLEETNKITLWNQVKTLIKWKDSKTPIRHKDSLLFIKF